MVSEKDFVISASEKEKLIMCHVAEKKDVNKTKISMSLSYKINFLFRNRNKINHESIPG